MQTFSITNFVLDKRSRHDVTTTVSNTEKPSLLARARSPASVEFSSLDPLSITVSSRAMTRDLDSVLPRHARVKSYRGNYFSDVASL